MIRHETRTGRCFDAAAFHRSDNDFVARNRTLAVCESEHLKRADEVEGLVVSVGEEDNPSRQNWRKRWVLCRSSHTAR